MKLFYICYEDLGIQAAWTTHIKEVTENLEKLGNKVILFAPALGRPLYKTTIDVIFVPTINLRYIREYLYYVMLFFYLLYYQTKKRVDLFYAREMGMMVGPAVIGMFFGIPLVMEVNGIYVDELKNIDASKIRILILSYLQSINLKLVTAIVAVTERIKKILVSRYHIDSEKVFVVHNGTNVDLFKPYNTEEAKKNLGLDKNKDYLIFVGSLYPHHGVEELILASPLIIKDYYNLYFLIVGDGVMRKRLEELAETLGVKERFVFTGSVPYREVPFYISASEIGVCFIKEREEGSPLKLYDYMACAKPVVVNKEGDMASLVENEGVGIAVDITDEKNIAHGILGLLRDKDRMGIIGLRGREVILKDYTWEITARNILKVFEDVITERR